jgi:MoaA/NifB/PqqE/SkfB family radical SAM enzyme
MEWTVEKTYQTRLDAAFKRFFAQALAAAFSSPRYIPFFARLALGQFKLSRVRAQNARSGLAVPPVIIASVTETCNLSCSGCYHRALHRDSAGELPTSRFREILEEAESLGIGISLLAGGEPFARHDIFTIADASKRMLFPIFTNGLMLDDARVAQLRRRPNLIPAISVEGGRESTDARRGKGSWDRITEVRSRLRKAGVIFGHSITVSSANLGEVTDPDFIRALRKEGARFFVFVEYVPVKEGTEGLLLGDSGRTELRSRIAGLRASVGGVILSFPGDEEAFGGCLAAGRGFIHVNPRGGLEPCPFAPFSDASLEGASLREALASPFLERIRRSHSALTETGGCALWANREWTAGLLSASLPARHGAGDAQGAAQGREPGIGQYSLEPGYELDHEGLEHQVAVALESRV